MTERNYNRQAVERFDLTGTIAWVVGGGGYLGVAVSRALAEHGAYVIIADLIKDAAEKAAKVLSDQGLKSEPMVLDIANEEDVKKAAENICKKHDRIDTLVNATAYSTGAPMQEMNLKQWQDGIAVTLNGAFLLSKEAGKIMTAQGKGSIIQFSSMYGKVSPDPKIYGPEYNVNPIDYGAAKAGISQMVRYQAVMFAPMGVRVNSIVPGPFPNPRGQGKDKSFVEKLSKKVPMGRVGKADEITGAVVFLASHASSFITGTEIVIDGGWTAW
jgi:gluconate 5-dehydrogenase